MSTLDLIRTDYVRFGGKPGASVGAIAVNALILPGLVCCILMRIQLRVSGAGRLRLAGLFRSLNHAITGADFVPGCTIGPGLLIHHPNGVVIGYGAEVGSDCTILAQVTLGESHVGPDGDKKYPRIGDGVTLGVGCTVLGDVEIGAGASVGASTVVLSDVPPGATMVGNPGKLVES